MTVMIDAGGLRGGSNTPTPMIDWVEEWSRVDRMTPVELGSLEKEGTMQIETTPPREWTWKQNWAKANFEEYEWNVRAATVQEIAYALRESKRLPEKVFAYHNNEEVGGDHEIAEGERLEFTRERRSEGEEQQITIHCYLDTPQLNEIFLITEKPSKAEETIRKTIWARFELEDAWYNMWVDGTGSGTTRIEIDRLKMRPMVKIRLKRENQLPPPDTDMEQDWRVEVRARLDKTWIRGTIMSLERRVREWVREQTQLTDTEYTLLTRGLQFTPHQIILGQNVVQVKEHQEVTADKKTQVFIQDGSEIIQVIAGSEEELQEQIEMRMHLKPEEYMLAARIKPGSKWQTIHLRRKNPQEKREVSRLVMRQGQTLDELYEEASELSGIPREQITIKDSRGRKINVPKPNQTAWISYGRLKGGETDNMKSAEKAEQNGTEKGKDEITSHARVFGRLSHDQAEEQANTKNNHGTAHGTDSRTGDSDSSGRELHGPKNQSPEEKRGRR
jgi:hypothetical protein